MKSHSILNAKSAEVVSRRVKGESPAVIKVERRIT